MALRKGSSIDAFANYWEGKSIDWDGQFGYQCTDLMREWIDNIKGKQLPGLSDGAKNGFKRADPKYWTKIKYIGKNKPKGGDILFYDATPTNKFGHTGVALRKDQTWPVHRVIDQNFGSKKVLKHEHNARQLNLIGWIRLLKKV